MQISRLDTSKAKRRTAELIAMLDVASAKIDRFGWANMDSGLKASLRTDWVDVLSKYELQEVKAGIDRVFRETGGNVRSVNEHQVAAAIQKNRSEEFARLPKLDVPKPAEERVTAEQAAEIMEQAGFKPRTFK